MLESSGVSVLLHVNKGIPSAAINARRIKLYRLYKFKQKARARPIPQ